MEGQPASNDRSESKLKKLYVTTKTVFKKVGGWYSSYLIFRYWKIYLLILTPFLLLPIWLAWDTEPKIAKTAYVVAIMGVYWVSEVLPISVTSLVPLVAFPALGVLTGGQVAKFYIHDLSFLFIGGLIFGVAVEKTGLHRRVALRILLVVGSRTPFLLAGIIGTTAFFSMWISNTATTAMFLPVIMAIAREFFKIRRQQRTVSLEEELHSIELQDVEGKKNADMEEADILDKKNLTTKELNLFKMLLLAVCYAANLGGTATLTGTLPNLVMTGLVTNTYGPEHPINYGTWMGYQLPGLVINLLLTWLWLQVFFLGKDFFRSFRKTETSDEEEKAFKSLLREKLAKHKRMTFAEKSVIFLFVILLLLWLTRVPLWGKLFNPPLQKAAGNVTIRCIDSSGKAPSRGKNFVTDGTCSILMAILLFIWPKTCPDFSKCFKREEPRPQPSEIAHAVVPNDGDELAENYEEEEEDYGPILDWRIVETRLPWGVVLLLGGGFAVGGAVKASGLSNLIGDMMKSLDMSPLGICAICLLVMCFTTEFTSNTATSNILLPIILGLAVKRNINPLYLLLPVTEAASFAFTLPVATPPNAIIFAAGIVEVKDMIMAGIVMNFICLAEVLLAINSWGYAMFNLGSIPAWADISEC